MLNSDDPELERLQAKLAETLSNLEIAIAIANLGSANVIHLAETVSNLEIAIAEANVINADGVVPLPAGMREETYQRALKRARDYADSNVYLHIDQLKTEELYYRRKIAERTAVIWAVIVDIGGEAIDPWYNSALGRFYPLSSPEVVPLSMHVEVFFQQLGLRLSEDGELLLRLGRKEETQLAVPPVQTKYVTYDGHVWLSTAPSRELAKRLGREQQQELAESELRLGAS